MFRQKIAADKNRHAPGDFAHRLEQRKAAIHLDGFIGQTRHTGFCQCFGQRPIRRQVQIGQEQLAGTQQRAFGRLRFLHFDNQVGLLKRRGVVVQEFRAGLFVVAVRVAGADACTALDNHLVPALDKLIGGGREQRDTILLVFDFFGNAYDHGARWTRVGGMNGGARLRRALISNG